jgi:hypothetical protein
METLQIPYTFLHYCGVGQSYAFSTGTFLPGMDSYKS